MSTQSDIAQQFLARLPRGEMWEPTPEWEALALALAGEPARTKEDALQLLADFMPDSCGGTGALISDWARLLGLPEVCASDTWDSMSDAEKQAAIIAKLRGRGQPDRASLESVLQAMRDDADLALLHLQHNLLTALAGRAGDPAYGEQWRATWTCVYMTPLIAGGDDLTLWIASGAVVTPNDAFSPVTEDATANTVAFADSDTLHRDVVAAADQRVQWTFWYRYESGAGTLTASVLDGDGNTVASLELGKDSVWERVMLIADTPTGAGDPRLVFTAAGAITVSLSWTWVGARDAAFECRARHLFPLNTTGEFAVQGEQDGTPAAGLPSDPYPILF